VIHRAIACCPTEEMRPSDQEADGIQSMRSCPADTFLLVPKRCALGASVVVVVGGGQLVWDHPKPFDLKEMPTT
jgi:hypothetical protein